MTVVFFFNDPATTEINTYCHTLSLPDSLPICQRVEAGAALLTLETTRTEAQAQAAQAQARRQREALAELQAGPRSEDIAQARANLNAAQAQADRKSTRLNSSH